MDNPVLNTISVLLYLYIVKIAGPAFMKDRKPYEFRRILFVYNMVLVALSGWMFYEVRFITLDFDCISIWIYNGSPLMNMDITGALFTLNARC